MTDELGVASISSIYFLFYYFLLLSEGTFSLEEYGVSMESQKERCDIKSFRL